ncbi:MULTISPECIES: metallophosphoesterase family protein [Bacillaceae]|uniref:Metallophosphatase family protein n=1 Tax=Evansella alkalicola TaxID=745819 RepID=A0ABS6JQM1_9BACI|nr:MULTISPECIES: metallophosphoesterase family protein [Bacillaceae]MBU9720577.1 metallophosphatase family protein [Bacillus alkalicola]
MKIAFVSDIHGNGIAFDAVLQDIASKNVDKTIVLGDLCFRGPEPKRSLDLVRSLNTTVLKGNADEWVLRGIKEGEVPDKALELMRKEREWTYNQLSEEDLEYLRSLPHEANIALTDELTIHAFHATPSSLFDVVPASASNEEMEEKLMGNDDASIFVYGHIHFPYIRFFKGKAVANLGSVGVPFDGLPQASYLLIEGQGKQFNIQIQRVAYDVEKTVQRYEDVGYPNLNMKKVIQNGSL